RPRFATNVESPLASGSSHTADAVCAGATYVTVTWKEPVRGFPLSSLAVHVTRVVPTPKRSPLAGSQTTLGESSTTSVALGGSKVTVRPSGSLVVTEMSPGRSRSVGAVLSTTVTSKDFVTAAPAESRTVQDTVVVVSTARTGPPAGVQVGVGSGSSSASVAETDQADRQPPVVSPSISKDAGTVRTGGVFGGGRSATTRIVKL